MFADRVAARALVSFFAYLCGNKIPFGASRLENACYRQWKNMSLQPFEVVPVQSGALKITLTRSASQAGQGRQGGGSREDIENVGGRLLRREHAPSDEKAKNRSVRKSPRENQLRRFEVCACA